MSLVRKTQRTPEGIALRKSWLLLLLFWCSTVLAPAAAVTEGELKAAFLYNFAKFVTWPATAFPSETAPIQVAVFGDEDFSVKLKSLLSDKKAHGRSFEVKRITNPQEAKNFQMVFVTSAESKRAPLILDATKKLPILTVGEWDQFLEWGGMINFVFEEARSEEHTSELQSQAYL